MQRGTLDLDHRVKTSKGDNGHCLRIIPVHSSQISLSVRGTQRRTYQIPFLHNSFVRTTAHMASSPLFPAPDDPAAALSLPLSPTTSASIPRSTIPKSIAWTARFSLWFFVRRLAVRMSERIVLRMNARRDDEVVRGRSGKRVWSKLGYEQIEETVEEQGMRDIHY